MLRNHPASYSFVGFLRCFQTVTKQVCRESAHKQTDIRTVAWTDGLEVHFQENILRKGFSDKEPFENFRCYPDWPPINRKRPLITDAQTITLDWYYGGCRSLLFAPLCKAEPLISTAAHQKFDLDPWPWPRPLTLTLRQCNSDVKTRFLALDLDLWPTTLTYNPNLAKVMVDLHTNYQGRRSNGSGVRALMGERTDGRYQAHYLPASLSYTIP